MLSFVRSCALVRLLVSVCLFVRSFIRLLALSLARVWVATLDRRFFCEAGLLGEIQSGGVCVE
jgi:hypothetical protein